MPAGLIRRNGRYSIRRVIPVDLQASYGRREITRALGTADPADARRCHAVEWVKLDQEFDTARARLAQRVAPPAQAQPMTVHTPEEAARLAQGWEDAKRDEMERPCEPEDWELPGYDEYEERVKAGVAHQLGLLAEQRANERRVAKANPPAIGMLLPAIADRWALEKKPTKKIIETTLKTAADFYSVVGRLPITAIKKQHIIDFKDSLVAKGEHPATANGRLNRLRILTRFAVANAMIDHDPTAGIRIASKALAKDARNTYDESALASVFGSPVFTEGLRPKAGAGEAAYWLPLLALYTGARLNELGQLRPSDVVEEPYVGLNNSDQAAWVIRIVADGADGLRLKTLSSARRVPIHSELIGLGFLRFVAAAKEAKQSKLFPLLKPDRFGTVTAGWSKWYGRYLRRTCKVSDSRVVFHSFRHTFKETARYCLMAADVQDEITGHETGNVASTYGGLSYPLHPLVEGMKQYRVPRFTPPHSPYT
jgi:integrase